MCKQHLRSVELHNLESKNIPKYAAIEVRCFCSYQRRKYSVHVCWFIQWMLFVCWNAAIHYHLNAIVQYVVGNVFA